MLGSKRRPGIVQCIGLVVAGAQCITPTKLLHTDTIVVANEVQTSFRFEADQVGVHMQVPGTDISILHWVLTALPV